MHQAFFQTFPHSTQFTIKERKIIVLLILRLRMGRLGIPCKSLGQSQFPLLGWAAGPTRFSRGFQGHRKKKKNSIIDLGLSLRTLQPEAYHHPSRHRYNDLISWPKTSSQLKSAKTTGHSRLAAAATEDCDEEAEGVQSRERWAFVKVNMDGVMIGRKVCLLDHAGYLSLACQLEQMFGRHTTSGLRLFEVESEYSLFYKDIEENWRNVGDIPWKGSWKRETAEDSTEA